MDDDKDWKRIEASLSDGSNISDEDLNKIEGEAIHNHLNGMNEVGSASEQQRIMSKSSMQQVVTQIEVIKTMRMLSKRNDRLTIALWIVGTAITLAIATN